jgi:hypothetical protein
MQHNQIAQKLIKSKKEICLFGWVGFGLVILLLLF